VTSSYETRNRTDSRGPSASLLLTKEWGKSQLEESRGDIFVVGSPGGFVKSEWAGKDRLFLTRREPHL